jgi:hypothetical protein
MVGDVASRGAGCVARHDDSIADECFGAGSNDEQVQHAADSGIELRRVPQHAGHCRDTLSADNGNPTKGGFRRMNGGCTYRNRCARTL